MIILKKVEDLQNFLKDSPGPVGFVPTMGALHQGHLALISEARKQSNTVVCSIFVNPTQFNDPRDFEKYPVTIDQDIALLEAAGTDFLFLPSVAELYPGGTTDLEKYNLGYLETVLEGAFRPGHFQGVCQVMFRLLQSVKAEYVFMGRKDYQQCMVVARLLEIAQISTKLITCETVREPDGLAMSSRNKRLSEIQRQKALGIYKSLIYAKREIKSGQLEKLSQEIRDILAQHECRIDYVEFANAQSLQLKHYWDGKEILVLLIAGFQGEVRLIDNMVLNP